MKKQLATIILILSSVIMLLTFVSCDSTASTEQETEATAPEFSFDLNDDNASYTLSGVSSQGFTEITIPSTYEGLPVTAIEGAFQNCSDLTSITIPDSIITIGWYAFKGCSGLTSVTIGKNVTTIGESAFQDCTSLTEIRLPEGVTKIDQCAFQGCASLEEINIPATVEFIGGGAFGGCNEKLSEVENGVVYVDTWAMGYSSSSELPAELVIRDGTLVIAGYAFSNCSEITSVVIPDSVRVISGFAFYQCGDISVTIGSGVEEIYDGVFEYCNVSAYHYKGTMAQWNAIDKTDGWNTFTYSQAATVICSDGTVTK